MKLNIFNIIIICASVQGIIFSGIILSSKKYKAKAHKFLALLVLVMSLSNMFYWFKDTGIYNQWPNYTMLYVPFDLLILPFYYFFVANYLGQERKYTKYLFLPFIIRYSFQIIEIIYKIFFVDVFTPSKSVLYYLSRFDEYATIAFILFVVFITFRLITDFERNRKTYNQSKVFIQTKWLKQLLYAGFAICAIWMSIVMFADLFPSILSSRQKYYFIWIGLSGLVYWLAYSGVYHIGIFNQRLHIRDDINSQVIKTTKKLTLNADRFIEIDDRIKREKLFVNPMISLKSIGQLFNLSEGYISQLINNHTKTNFSTYINALRVEEAKGMLINPKYSNYTIISIALEAGFNSKSAFYTSFKQITGVSPSQYKAQNIS